MVSEDYLQGLGAFLTVEVWRGINQSKTMTMYANLDSQIASDFKSNPKSQQFEIAAISGLICNRFRGDSAAILRSALRFQVAILLRFEIAAIAILRSGHLSTKISRTIS